MAHVVEFEPGHVAGSAAVLARRHAAHRAVTASLPPIASFDEQVTSELEGATGAVALDGERVVGYLIGRHDADEGGPRVWSGVAGHAADEPELLRDLYAVAASRWVAEGLRRHFVFAPALPAHVDPWFRLSFGASAIQAARPSADGFGPLPRDVTVRRVEPRDVPVAARLERLLFLSLLESPSFSAITADPVERYEEEWRQLLDDEATYVGFVAELDGVVVGEAFLYRRPAGDLRVPPSSIDLASAVVDPSCRRRGVATALAASAVAWARDHGIETVITDWRMTNLLASRTWPRLGFAPTFQRLYRVVP
jgi:GNAT superfamily N-acetyltransferase